MSDAAKSLRVALLAIAVFALVIAAAPPVFSADLPMPDQVDETASTISADDYLNRYADLLLLRLRFAAIPDSELTVRMRAAAKSLGNARPPPGHLETLRDDLTAELLYYVVNLKYLIWTGGVVWPQDKPEAAYRSDALSELAAIARELTQADVLGLDIGAILHRLETIDAWTEGLDRPVQDWFDPERRKRLVEDAKGGSRGPTRT